MLAVYKVTRDAIARASRGEGSTLIECLTRRLSGHSTSDDPRAYRQEAEMAAERKEDPIPRFRAYVTRACGYTEAREKAFVERMDAEIKQCIERSEKAPQPELDTMFTDVFAEMPPHLREQYEEAMRAPRGGGHGH